MGPSNLTSALLAQAIRVTLHNAFANPRTHDRIASHIATTTMPQPSLRNNGLTGTVDTRNIRVTHHDDDHATAITADTPLTATITLSE